MTSPGGHKTKPTEVIPSPPRSPFNPREAKFQSLLRLHRTIQSHGSVSTVEAMDWLCRELDSYVERTEFFEWANKYFKTEKSEKLTNAEFKNHLAGTNWIRGGLALSLVNSRLCSTTDYQSDFDYIPLGRFGNLSLSLLADSTVMVPQETDSSTLGCHDPVAVNPNNVLGAQYECFNDSSKKKTLVFAQFGKISMSIDNRHQKQPPTRESWNDTGFVLALEILESGSAGNFYMICNLTKNMDGGEEISDDQFDGDPRFIRFCGQDSLFTIAQVDGQRLDLLKDSWEDVHVDDEICLNVVSKARPKIVETGLAKDGDTHRLVALCPVSLSTKVAAPSS